jgi:hypothetical protein
MDMVKSIIELSKLMSVMAEKGATEQELKNVVEFFKAAIETTLAVDNIYEFSVLNEYREKYCK